MLIARLALFAGTASLCLASGVAFAGCVNYHSVCLSILWCMGPEGHEFADPLRKAAHEGDDNRISYDIQECQNKYGSHGGVPYSIAAGGCSREEIKAAGESALNGLCGG
jgi:hypothetical protein